MAGLADLRRGPEQRSRIPDIPVTLAEMDAVGTEAFGQCHAVVDDERDASISADALQRLGESRQLVLFNVLHPELERRRDARLDRRLQAVREQPRRPLAG